MNKRELNRFKKDLLERKAELLKNAENMREKGITFDPDDLADEVDLASSEADQSLTLLLRDRERVLVRKIDKALQKIEKGDYGICESCDEEIGVKRMEARPVTDLCIRCKEEQEKIERNYAEMPR